MTSDEQLIRAQVRIAQLEAILFEIGKLAVAPLPITVNPPTEAHVMRELQTAEDDR